MSGPPIRKICKNCKHEKSAGSFYKSKRSKDGLTTLCKSCQSIRDEDNDNFLVLELHKFETQIGRKAHSVRREIEKFKNEYRTGHWEPAILCLGRISEAQVFELARCLGVQIEFPDIPYLNQLQSSHDKISNALRDLLSELSSFEKTEKKLQEEIKTLIAQTISFSFDIQEALDAGNDQLKVQDSNFAIAGIKKNVNSAKKSVFAQKFEPLYREIMAKRNTAAHAPRDQQAKLRKKDIQELRPKVKTLVNLSCELLGTDN